MSMKLSTVLYSVVHVYVHIKKLKFPYCNGGKSINNCINAPMYIGMSDRDMWRSYGRIFSHWICLYFSLCLWGVILCPAFVN